MQFVDVQVVGGERKCECFTVQGTEPERNAIFSFVGKIHQGKKFRILDC